MEREFAREYHLITRDDRLEKVAEDIVKHFTGRGFRGKAMVVSIDKATAVRMHDKVRKHWLGEIVSLKVGLAKVTGPERLEMEDLISYMESSDMAVVVSPSQNEIDELLKKGADIVPHRRRMVKEDLDTKFKDPDDPFRIVFVCAMWMTGFDVPCCSTIYLDKPMRNHTLMQTIARANRVFRDKVDGLIVDYVGVFRNLQKALAIYGPGTGGNDRPEDSPVKAKSELLEMLKKAVADAVLFCQKQGMDLEGIIKAKAFERIKLMDQAIAQVLVSDDVKKRFINLVGSVSRLYKAVLPDPQASLFTPMCALFRATQLKIESLQPGADISKIMKKVDELLDQSIAANGYIIEDDTVPYKKHPVVDLSKIDFEKLKQIFSRDKKRIEAEKLRGILNASLARMVRRNRTRTDYLERFQKMIDEYNAGAMNIEEFFNKLLEFAGELKDEEARSIREKLSEEELAVFDLIIKPDMKLTRKDEILVKKVAKDLLETLKDEMLVLDWRKQQATRAAVRVAIEEKMEGLPEVFTKKIFQQKCDIVFQHIFESYYGRGKSIYATG